MNASFTVMTACHDAGSAEQSISPLVIRNDFCRTRIGSVNDLEGAALASIICDKCFAIWKVCRGPKVEMAGILLVAVAMFLDGPLVDGAAIGHQEHRPMWHGPDQRP